LIDSNISNIFRVKRDKNQTMKDQIIDLINSGKVDELTKIRNQYPENIPLELLHFEVREELELIDEFLNQN
jgi:hypothetical protein